MKSSEIIVEARIHYRIKNILKDKGYKYINRGQDQDVYLAPDGTILKIYGYEEGDKFSKSQMSFIDYAKFCKANPNNPFLLQILGWETFQFEGNNYLQIKTERLFPFTGIKDVAKQLAQLAEEIARSGARIGLNRFINRSLHTSLGMPKEYADEKYKNFGILTTLLGGKEGLKIFADTIEKLSKIAKAKGYVLDLHSGNFMLGSDGEIVINDPFWDQWGTMRI